MPIHPSQTKEAIHVLLPVMVVDGIDQDFVFFSISNDVFDHHIDHRIDHHCDDHHIDRHIDHRNDRQSDHHDCLIEGVFHHPRDNNPFVYYYYY